MTVGIMPFINKLLLRKRFIIETLFDKLKSSMGLEHTRHRSPTNAFVHVLSCLAAYALGSKNCHEIRVLSRTRVKSAKILRETENRDCSQTQKARTGRGLTPNI